MEIRQRESEQWKDWTTGLNSSLLHILYPYPCHGLLSLGFILWLAFVNDMWRQQRLEICGTNEYNSLHFCLLLLKEQALGSPRKMRGTWSRPGPILKPGVKPRQALAYAVELFVLPLSFWRGLLYNIILAIAGQWEQRGEDFSEEWLTETGYLSGEQKIKKKLRSVTCQKD